MGNLVTFQEILTRYEAGENAFDLTLEKWVKIREFLKEALTMTYYREILGAATIKVPLCLENQDKCAKAPYRLYAAEEKRDHLVSSCGRFRLTALRGISFQSPRCSG